MPQAVRFGGFDQVAAELKNAKAVIPPLEEPGAAAKHASVADIAAALATKAKGAPTSAKQAKGEAQAVVSSDLGKSRNTMHYIKMLVVRYVVNMKNHFFD